MCSSSPNGFVLNAIVPIVFVPDSIVPSIMVPGVILPNVIVLNVVVFNVVVFNVIVPDVFVANGIVANGIVRRGVVLTFCMQMEDRKTRMFLEDWFLLRRGNNCPKMLLMIFHLCMMTPTNSGKKMLYWMPFSFAPWMMALMLLYFHNIYVNLLSIQCAHNSDDGDVRPINRCFYNSTHTTFKSVFDGGCLDLRSGVLQHGRRHHRRLRAPGAAHSMIVLQERALCTGASTSVSNHLLIALRRGVVAAFRSGSLRFQSCLAQRR